MKRWHQDYSVTFREWRKHHRQHVQSTIERGGELNKDPYQVDCVCDEQKGRFRKHHAGDCGYVHCRVCHWDKYPKRRITVQERLSLDRLKEGVREIREM